MFLGHSKISSEIQIFTRYLTNHWHPASWRQVSYPGNGGLPEVAVKLGSLFIYIGILRPTSVSAYDRTKHARDNCLYFVALLAVYWILDLLR